jgi:energy-coupling factor transporter ATP-binding protein EcfA2
MLFSGDEGDKRLSALSGGEAARLVFSRLALQRPNVLVLDEPTNHLDLESIEALVAGLQSYDGTLILVSHDRWFVSQLASRVVEISRTGIRDYHGTYDEYVASCGDDHLDADTVVLRARREGRKSSGRRGPAVSNGGRRDEADPARDTDAASRRRLEDRLVELTAAIEDAEQRIAEIDEQLCRPGYYEDTAAEAVAETQRQRTELLADLESMMAEWERTGQALDGAGSLA